MLLRVSNRPNTHAQETGSDLRNPKPSSESCQEVIKEVPALQNASAGSCYAGMRDMIG